MSLAACRLGAVLHKISSLKFLEPSVGEEVIKEHCQNVRQELTDAIRSLEEEFR
jgi:hypothetical protein